MTQIRRDAVNPQALAKAIATWRCDRSDEADIALEAAFLEHGVITPDDIVEEVAVTGDNLCILLGGGALLTLFRDGSVHVFGPKE